MYSKIMKIMKIMKGVLVAVAGAVVIGIPFFVIGWVVYIINPKTTENHGKTGSIYN